MSNILDGKEVAKKIKKEIQEEIQKNICSKKRPPRLEILLVGNEYASQKYVRL